MAIKLPPPPSGATEVLLENDFGSNRSRSLRTDSLASDAMSITYPHRVYAIPRDAILRGELLAAAQPVAWRYLLVNSDSAVGAAEIAEDADGAVTFLGKNEGPFVQATVDALNVAQDNAEVQQGDFELRLLRIPSVYVVALWLHSESSDLLLPLQPTAAGLASDRIYRADDVLTAVKPYAEASARFDPS